MALFDTLVAAIPLLGILIFVHEFGHFLVAKACGVRVLKFSIGFGAPIGVGERRLRWERGGTEYVVGWIPLGGFVRMLGEQLPGDEEHADVPADARPDEFLDAKPTWQKLAISFAGPAMNLAFPILAFSILLFAGIPREAPVIGMVERGSPAEIAGLQAGDRVLEVAGEPIAYWGDLASHIVDSDADELPMVVDRDGERVELMVGVGRKERLDAFGEATGVGWIGISWRRLPALIGVIDLTSPAAEAGLQSGDQVVALGGAEVEDWMTLERAFAAGSANAAGGVLPISVLRGAFDDADKRRVELEVPALGSLQRLGVVSATILVSSVQEGLPAAEAGLAPGDLVLSVDGEPVGSFSTFADAIQTSDGRPLEIGYARDGVLESTIVQPIEREVAHPMDIAGMTQIVYQIGVRHALATLPGIDAKEQVRNPFVALPRAFWMTVDTSRLYLEALGKMASGGVGADQLSGPIGIAEIARKSLDLGWMTYLSTMIFISINLGFLNLLPIPILDGGQILIFAIEGIKRSPISVRTREITQQIGLVFLVMLMGLAFFNDLSRHWEKFIKWLSA
jgi:regulator of sigma E protease